MACNVGSVGIETKLIIQFLHRLFPGVEVLPRLLILWVVFLDVDQKRTKSPFLKQAHQPCIDRNTISDDYIFSYRKLSAADWQLDVAVIALAAPITLLYIKPD